MKTRAAGSLAISNSGVQSGTGSPGKISYWAKPAYMTRSETLSGGAHGPARPNEQLKGFGHRIGSESLHCGSHDGCFLGALGHGAAGDDLAGARQDARSAAGRLGDTGAGIAARQNGGVADDPNPLIAEKESPGAEPEFSFSVAIVLGTLLSRS